MTTPTSPDFDVIVIGAGISGINAAYRLQTQASSFSYTILEARNGMGGTWDFFKYPGIRSDSDLWTFGFPWAPWQEQRAIADGASIKAYIEKTARDHGIDRRIQYGRRVVTADWSSDQQLWRLGVECQGEMKTMHAKFVLFGTGTTTMRIRCPLRSKDWRTSRGHWCIRSTGRRISAMTERML